MTVDALDHGGDDSFPHLPRTPDGWLDTARMPVGLQWQEGADGDRYLVDLTPSVRLSDGRLVPVTAVCAPEPGSER